MQCLMWILCLAVVSLRHADMTSKICRYAPASLQEIHEEKKT